MSEPAIQPPAPVPEPVVSFSGPYWFLANPFPCPVMHEGQLYPSAEHAFQAAKTTDWQIRWNIAGIGSWRDARRLGRQVQLRPGWDQLRRPVMLSVVLDKFVRNPDLGAALTATGNRTLLEGNTWGDYSWGAIPHHGQGYAHLPLWYAGDQIWAGHNWLGWTLMAVRDVLTEVA